MSYPSTIDSPDTTMQGGSLLATNDHAANHRTLGSAIVAIENKVGVGSGSAAANQALIGNGAGQSSWTSTWNNATLGTPTVGTPAITGGTYSSGVFGTPSVDLISARNAGTGVGFSNSMFPAEGTITDSAGGTFTVDARAAQIYYCVLGTAAGNRTIATPTNLSPYQQITYAFKTSGSANGTLVWSSSFRISQDVGTPALGTGVGWNYYGWRYNAIDSKLDYVGQSKNLI